MQTALEKKLLIDVIDSLPPNEFNVIYRMFSSFINDYLDSHLSDEEYKEHIDLIKNSNDSDFIFLSDLAD